MKQLLLMMVLLNEIQIGQLKILNDKVYQNESAQECGKWLKENPRILKLLQNNETLEFGSHKSFASPMHTAIERSRKDIVRSFNSRKIQINVMKKWAHNNHDQFCTPLHLAVEKRDVEMVSNNLFIYLHIS